MSKMEIPKLAVIALVIATAAWGGLLVVAKSTLPIINPIYMTVIRYSCTAVLLTLILLFFEGKRSFKVEEKMLPLLGYGALGFAGSSIFSLWGLHYTHSENGAVVMACQPLIAAIFNWVLKDIKPRWVTLSCIVFALLGIFLVMTGGHYIALFNSRESLGNFFILLGAISWVVYSFGTIEYPSWSPLRYTTLTCLFGLFSVFFITVITTISGYTPLPSFEAVQAVIPQLTYIILIGSVLTFLCWNYGINRIGTLNGVIFINLVPVTTFLITSVQGHSIAFVKIVGVTMVIIAVIGNNLLTRKRPVGQF